MGAVWEVVKLRSTPKICLEKMESADRFETDISPGASFEGSESGVQSVRSDVRMKW